MPTLKQVAEQAGVSTATVSKVLSNTPYFTEETRQKVMQAVEELGYVPNLAARALTSGKTNIIAIVFPYVFDVVFTDPFVQSVLKGVELECSQRGYNLLLSTPRLSPAGPDENYMQLIRSGYLDGMVALDNVPTTSVVKPAQKAKIPTVALGYNNAPYYVRTDDFQGGIHLVEHVIALGHQNIGILTIPAELNLPVHERIEGIRQATSLADVTLYEYTGDFSLESGAKGLQYFVENHPNITAVIGINDRMAIGAMRQAQSMGIAIPEDMIFVGYDNIPLAELVSPALTTIDQSAPQLGQLATQMLLDVIDGKTPDSIVLQPKLIVRGSSASHRE